MPFCFSVSRSFGDVVACEFAFGVWVLSGICVRFACDCFRLCFRMGECNVLVDPNEKKINFVLLVRSQKSRQCVVKNLRQFDHLMSC